MLALDTTKSKEIERQALKSQRDIDLMAITHDFGDGRVVQVRPIDVSNFQLVISQGQPREWVLADNSVAVLQVAEMQAALNAGIVKAEAIWDKYMTDLKAL